MWPAVTLSTALQATICRLQMTPPQSWEYPTRRLSDPSVAERICGKAKGTQRGDDEAWPVTAYLQAVGAV
jgi:hypothetical protein